MPAVWSATIARQTGRPETVAAGAGHDETAKLNGAKVTEISITVTGVDEIVKKLGSGWAVAAMRKPMEDSLLSVLDYMQDYPGPPQRPYPNMLRTPKQRRWFFRALKLGLIQVPYVRTGKLGQSWTWTIGNVPGGLHGKVGTNMAYAKYVQNAGDQALIHQGNWRTDAGAIQELRNDIVARFRRDIAAYVTHMNAT
jgi:hypothetical protein